MPRSNHWIRLDYEAGDDAKGRTAATDCPQELCVRLHAVPHHTTRAVSQHNLCRHDIVARKPIAACELANASA